MNAVDLLERREARSPDGTDDRTLPRRVAQDLEQRARVAADRLLDAAGREQQRRDAAAISTAARDALDQAVALERGEQAECRARVETGEARDLAARQRMRTLGNQRQQSQAAVERLDGARGIDEGRSALARQVRHLHLLTLTVSIVQCVLPDGGDPD